MGLEIVIICWIAGWAVKNAVNDVAASTRGKPPPSHQKWAAREFKRAARDGRKARTAPGYGRRLWDNAVAEWAERADQRHHARMEFIRARAPQRNQRWLDRRLARAQRWDNARDAAAQRLGVAWRSTRSGTANAVKAGAGWVADSVTGRTRDGDPIAAPDLAAVPDIEPAALAAADLSGCRPAELARASGVIGDDDGPVDPSTMLGLDRCLQRVRSRRDTAVATADQARAARDFGRLREANTWVEALDNLAGELGRRRNKLIWARVIDADAARHLTDRALHEMAGVPDDVTVDETTTGGLDHLIAQARKTREAAQARAAGPDGLGMDMVDVINTGRLLGELQQRRVAAARHERAQQQPPTDADTPATGTDAGTTTTNGDQMAATQPTGEITDLPTAVAFTEQMAGYFTTLGNTLEEPAGQAQQAAKDLGQAPSIIEGGQAALSGHGFGDAITGKFAAASEAATAAQQAMDTAARAMADAREKATTAQTAFGDAGAALSSQSGIAEQVQTHKGSGAGVASSTDFYANA